MILLLLGYGVMTAMIAMAATLALGSDPLAVLSAYMLGGLAGMALASLRIIGLRNPGSASGWSDQH